MLSVIKMSNIIIYIYIHTVATGLCGSLPRCSTTFFTIVEMVEGVKLVRGGATVVEARVVELWVELMVLATLSTTCLATSFTTAVMLMAGWSTRSVVLTTEEMTGAVELSATSS